MLIGCERDSQTEVLQRAQSTAKAEPNTAEEFLELAKRLQRNGDLDRAADAAYKALIQEPENGAAKLLAGRIEAARRNHETAAEIAGSIDVRSRLGRPAVELHYEQLMKCDRPSDAVDVILSALQTRGEMSKWRHQAWGLLNELGRREEASAQAISLCRSGEATTSELLSLVRRNESYPTPAMLKKEGNENPSELFRPGLGMARWHSSQLDFRAGLAELATQNEAGFRTSAACALYGRLLTETQSSEEFSAWHAKCSDEVRQTNDYWAALGTYFFDAGQFEASAHALLNAVRRDPTDRTSLQRLAKVFDALGRADDGLQFRHRGTAIAATEEDSDALYVASDDLQTSGRLTRRVMDLGRPFETLQWTLLRMPAAARNERATVAAQRNELLNSKRALQMAAESSLIEIDPDDFEMEPAYRALVDGADGAGATSSVATVEVLAQPRLVNVAAQRGLDFQWYQDVEINLTSIPIHESIGGGIGVLDYDLDGWPDVYLTQGSGEPPTDQCTRSSVLFRNVAGEFAAVTPQAAAEDRNYSSGIAAGDVNQDGFPDLYLGSLGRNRLLINNGDGTFRDATEGMGELADRFTSSLAIADINGDSLPDLFEANYIEMEGGFTLPTIGDDGREELPSPLFHYADSDRWFENLGDGRFQMHEVQRDVAKPGTSLGIIVTDFNGNGMNEVFVGNDVRGNHFLMRADKNLFVNAADVKGIANGFSGSANGCMGIASGDFDRDGRLDLHITNYAEESANLYLQSEGGGFTDSAVRYRLDTLSFPNVGFGTKAIDIDRNGWLDLVVTNGHIFDMSDAGEEFRMAPQMLMRKDRNFELVSVADDSGYWEGRYLGRAMATLDFDRDRRIDFLIGHLDQPLALLQNQTETVGRGIQLELVGTGSERDAIGARVVVTAGDEVFSQWMTAGDGYFCSDEPVIDIGIGTNEVEQVEIFWPSGQRQTFAGLQYGKRYLIVEGAREGYPREP